MIRIVTPIIAVIFGLVGNALADETQVTLEDQTSVGVTIYNNNLALVRDARRINVGKGESRLAFIDVSAQIQPETASLDGGKFAILEQNFDFDLLSPGKLLEKAVGQTVQVYRVNPATGSETAETGTILSTNGGIVLQVGERIEVMRGGAAGLPGRIVFDKVPPNLRARPTLSMTIDAKKKGEQDVVLNYLTGGLGWKADYVANLSTDEKTVSLQGWVTLTNTSGTTYSDAMVQLVAGEPNRVTPVTVRRRESRGMELAAAMPSQDVAEESLFEYHLYTLPQRTSVAENQTKQVAFIEAPSVKVRKVLEVRGRRSYFAWRYSPIERQPAAAFVMFDNKKSSGLGKPLPKGIMRFYMQDSRGLAQFVGEDRIGHTPENEEVRLSLGQSFDVTLWRKQTEYRETARRELRERVVDVRSSHEIILKNAKGKVAQVRVIEPLGGDWEILDESHPHKKESASQAVWLVDVPAKGEAKLTYTVLTKDAQ